MLLICTSWYFPETKEKLFEELFWRNPSLWSDISSNYKPWKKYLFCYGDFGPGAIQSNCDVRKFCNQKGT